MTVFFEDFILNRKYNNNILDELDKFVPEKNKHIIIENRAANIIASAINLMRSIQENFSEKDSEELQKRLINSIRSEDEKKFIRKIREFKDRDDSRRD